MSEPVYLFLDNFETGTVMVEVEKSLNYSWSVLKWGPGANFHVRMRPRWRVFVGKTAQKTITVTEPSLWTI